MNSGEIGCARYVYLCVPARAKSYTKRILLLCSFGCHQAGFKILTKSVHGQCRYWLCTLALCVHAHTCQMSSQQMVLFVLLMCFLFLLPLLISCEVIYNFQKFGQGTSKTQERRHRHIFLTSASLSYFGGRAQRGLMKRKNHKRNEVFNLSLTYLLVLLPICLPFAYLFVCLLAQLLTYFISFGLLAQLLIAYWLACLLYGTP